MGKIFIILLTIFVVFLWIKMNEIELSKMWATIKTLNILPAAAACIFLLLTYLFYSLALKLLIRPFRKVTLIKVFQIYLASAFITQLVPAQQVGLVTNVYLLKKLCDVPIAKAISAFSILILVEWLVSFLFLLLIPVSTFNAPIVIKNLVGLAAAFFILLILILFLLLRLKQEGANLINKLLFFIPLNYRTKFSQFYLSIVEGWELIMKQKINLVLIITILLFLPLIHLMGGGLVFYSLEFPQQDWNKLAEKGLPQIILSVIIGQAILFLLFKLPSLPGHIGTLEWYVTLIFVYGFSFPKHLIAVLSVVIHALFFITTAIAGAICIFTLGINISKLKEELIKEKKKLEQKK